MRSGTKLSKFLRVFLPTFVQTGAATDAHFITVMSLNKLSLTNCAVFVSSIYFLLLRNHFRRTKFGILRPCINASNSNILTK